MLRRLFAGDAEAVGWLYDTFAPGLFRRLRGRYGEGLFEPRDLLQDAFVSCLQHDYKVLRDFARRWPEAGQTRSRLENQLWNLACGLASNRRRSARRQPRIQSLEGVSEHGVGDLEQRLIGVGDLEQRLIDQDLIARLERCLQHGDELVYLYLKLRHADGMAPREISRVTGWPVKEVYRHKESLDRAIAECVRKLGVDRR